MRLGDRPVEGEGAGYVGRLRGGEATGIPARLRLPLQPGGLGASHPRPQGSPGVRCAGGAEALILQRPPEPAVGAGVPEAAQPSVSAGVPGRSALRSGRGTESRRSAFRASEAWSSPALRARRGARSRISLPRPQGRRGRPAAPARVRRGSAFRVPRGYWDAQPSAPPGCQEVFRPRPLPRQGARKGSALRPARTPEAFSPPCPPGGRRRPRPVDPVAPRCAVPGARRWVP